MQRFVDEFGAGIYYILHVVMSGIGFVDAGFTAFMLALGVANPGLQLDLLLIMVVAVVTLTMRAIGGGSGWVILLLCVLLLMHRVLPGVGGVDALPVASPLQSAL